MPTINFDALFENLKAGVASVARDSLTDYERQAKSDGQHALTTMKLSLQHWAAEVENGAMNEEDLGFLLKGAEALNEMTALKEAGLAAIHIDKFKNDVINLIIGTLTSFIKV